PPALCSRNRFSKGSAGLIVVMFPPTTKTQIWLSRYERPDSKCFINRSARCSISKERPVELTYLLARRSIRKLTERRSQRSGRKLSPPNLPTAKKHIAAVRLHAPQSHVIFDTVDLHFLRAAREAELTQKIESRTQARETQEQEYAVINEADETWVVSVAERELLLQDLPGKQIEVVSNIVDIQTPTTAFVDRADFLFIGSFLHPPNVDAVLYFAKEIYPLVAQHLPTAKF